MQPIERYGVITLLLLVVIVAAVVMWDQGEKALLVSEGGPSVAVLDGLSRKTQTKKAQIPRGASQRRAKARQPAFKAQSWKADTAKTEVLNKRDEAAQFLEQMARAEEALRFQPAIEQEPKRSLGPQQPPKLAGNLIKPKPKPTVAKAPSPSSGIYEVQAGDTLGQIAVDQLGSYRHLAALEAANPEVDAARLSIGTQLRLPRIETIEGVTQRIAAKSTVVGSKKTSSAGVPDGRDYSVVSGDSFWVIAARELGDGNRYREIAALNPSLNPDALVLGTALVLPSGAASKKAASKPDQQSVATVSTKRGVVR